MKTFGVDLSPGFEFKSWFYCGQGTSYKVAIKGHRPPGVFSMYIGSLMTLCGRTIVRYVWLQRLQPSSPVSQPSDVAGSQSSRNHATTLQL